ncbi:MAG TPA: serine/threonine-protein kinase [Planctomycetota bacterium]|nr:serine/threonine-protein kinase [Planctomycetota bacterium]
MISQILWQTIVFCDDQILSKEWRNRYAYNVMDDFWVSKSIEDYRLERWIHSGKSKIYLAYSSKMQKHVVVKIFESTVIDEMKSFNAWNMFLQAANASVGLVHPNIITNYEVQEKENFFYAVSQYNPGINLEKCCQDKGVYSLDEVIEILKNILPALQCAHDANIVHRNIKPANIISKGLDEYYIGDFGLACPKSLASVALSGFSWGSLGFMAPEQARGIQKIDHRTDFYSLGCTIFYLLTGQAPITGENKEEILFNHSLGNCLYIQEFCQGLPELFVRILNKMLDKNRNKRFNHAQEIVHALKNMQEKAMFSVSQPAFYQTQTVKENTQLLSSVLFQGETDLSQHLCRCFNLKDPTPCSFKTCKQEWSLEDVHNKNAVFFQGKIWCPECLWTTFSETMVDSRVKKVSTLSFATVYLAIQGLEKYIPGSPIRYFYKFELNRAKKGWKTVLKRIERGYTIASKICANHILSVDKFVKYQELGYAYVPAEYIAGVTLEELLQKERLPISVIITILRRLAQAMNTLYKKGIVHRGISSKSIYISLNGSLRLGNFFVAKYWEKPDASLGNITQSMKTAIGNLHYMSPEQTINSFHVDFRSDIWAWGVVAYELIEHKKPFTGATALAIVHEIREKPCPSFHPTVPNTLQSIVQKALNKNAKERYSSVKELLAALDTVKV